MNDAPRTLHATCVAIAREGVLLLGPSGSGKSDLALRLIDRGAVLVADDQVTLAREGDSLVAAAPPRLSGLLEARGVGILRMAHLPRATLRLAVTLVARAAVERMPEPEFFGCAGLQLPLLSLHAFDRATEAKIRMALGKGKA